MSHEFWSDGALSIVLLPSGPQGDALRALAGEWTELGYLAPALWTRPEDVEQQINAPPIIRTSVFGQDVSGELTTVRTDLFKTLARQRLRLVRLVTVRSVLPDRELDEVQDAIGRTVADYVAYSIPLETSGATVANLRNELSKITLICAPTEYQLRERVEWVTGDDSVTLIASPEDRSSPWAGDAFVRDDERFTGFTLMHIATVAGLWNGLPKGTLELFKRDRSSGGQVWISRVFVSGVVTEGLAQGTSVQVLAQAADAASPLVDPYSGVLADGTSAIPEEHIGLYRRGMVEAAFHLDGDTLTYSRPQHTEAQHRTRVSITELIAQFLAFSTSVLVHAPLWYWRYAKAGIARALGRTLHGTNGMQQVDDGSYHGLDASDRALADSLTAMRSEQDRLGEEMAQPVPPHSVRSTPRLWSGLREIVFGSIDGSADLSDRGFAPVEGLIPVFGRVADVIHDPNDRWTTDPVLVAAGMAAEIGPLDWQETAQLQAHFAGQIEGAQAKLDAGEIELLELTAERAVLDSRREEIEPYLVYQGALTLSADGVVSPNAVAPRADAPDQREVALAGWLAELRQIGLNLQLLHRKQTATESFITTLRTEIDAHSAGLGRFLEWSGRHGGNFGSHLLERMGLELQTAESDADDLTRVAGTLTIPQPGTMARLRRRFYARLAVLWVVVIAVAALLMLLPVFDDEHRLPRWWPEWQWTTGVAIAVILVVCNALLVSYFRKRSRFERSATEILARLQTTCANATHARREVVRLQSLYAQTLAWLDLIAAALHRPWKAKSTWLDHVARDPDPESLPFAMRVARAQEIDSDSSRTLQRSAAAGLVKRGWRAAAFQEMLAAIRDDLRLDAQTLSLESLDNDLPHLSNNSRTILRENMGRERILESVAEKRLGLLIEQVQLGSLCGPHALVEPVELDPLAVIYNARIGSRVSKAVPWDAFLMGALGGTDDVVTPLSALGISPYELPKGHNQDVDSYVIVPARLENELRTAGRQKMTTCTHDDRDSNAFDVVVRIDMAGPLPVESIHLWGTTRRARPEASPPQASSAAAVPVCLTCGRASCVATDPASGVKCDFTGV